MACSVMIMLMPANTINVTVSFINGYVFKSFSYAILNCYLKFF